MLASGVVEEGSWMGLRRDEIERRDGSRGTYAFVEKSDFALVIPAEDDGFHLVEEFRYPIGRRTWSFPQGGFPHGQSGSPEELARLELMQETGLRARELIKLGFLHCAHGISSQGGHFFLATGLEPGAPEREREEQDMRQAWLPRARFEEMIGEGVITDDSTVAAYALLLLSERGQGRLTVWRVEQRCEQVAVARHPVQDHIGGEEQGPRLPAGLHLLPASPRRSRGGGGGPQRARGRGRPHARVSLPTV